MTDTPSKAPWRQANGRFGSGNPGGRKGTRSRGTHEMMITVLEDFAAHKEELLHRLRSSYTPHYFNTVMRVMPKQLENEVPEFETYSDAEAAGVVRIVRQVLALQQNPRNVLAELEAILSKDPAEYVAKAG